MTQTQGPRDLNAAREAFKFTIRWEGGYVNNPDDPGGETKWGISKRQYPHLDIKNLTPEEGLQVYFKDYWLPSGADALPYPECAVVFDTALLCGPGRAAAWLRQAPDPYQYLELRRQFHLTKAREKWAQTFIKGWLNRVNDLKRLVDEAKKAP